MNKYPKFIIRSRNKTAAEGTYKAYLKLRQYINSLKIRYTREVISFERRDPIPKYEKISTNAAHLLEEGTSLKELICYSLFISFGIGYALSKFTYDTDLQYFLYIRYPKQMMYYDNLKDMIKFRSAKLKEKLPFEGNFPDLSRPENINKLKKELKNYFFNTNSKEIEKKRIEQEIISESKEININLRQFDTYLEEQENKLRSMSRNN